MTSKTKSPAKTVTKHPLKTFERKGGAMPTLRRAASAVAAAEPKLAAEPDEPAMTVPGFLSQREVLLRLVETLKAL